MGLRLYAGTRAQALIFLDEAVALASRGKPEHVDLAAPETVAGIRSPEQVLEESPDTTWQRAA